MESNVSTLIRKYWLLFFFIIVFIFMAIFKISFRDIWMAVSSLTLWQFVLLLLISLLISLFQIISRKYLLHSLLSPTKFKNLVFVHFSSMAAHYSTPAKIGFPLAVYLLNKFDGVPYSSGTTMILIEIMVSTIICGIIASIGGFFYFTDQMKVLVVSFFYLLIFGVLAIYGIYVFLRKSAKKSPAYLFIKNACEAFSHITVYHLVIYICLLVFIQLLGGITLVLLASFLNKSISLWQAVVANSTAFFLGAISMIPMGLGVREASILLYLKHLGITNEIGISIVTIQRLFSTGLSFALGMIFGGILGVKHPKKDSV